MPRKQNAFGNPKSFAFKPSKGVNKSKGQGAAGYYPSNRQYGSSVQRTVIEHYDLDSNWVKWRKGYEYYARAALSELEIFNSVRARNTKSNYSGIFPITFKFCVVSRHSLSSQCAIHWI